MDHETRLNGAGAPPVKPEVASVPPSHNHAPNATEAGESKAPTDTGASATTIPTPNGTSAASVASEPQSSALSPSISAGSPPASSKIPSMQNLLSTQSSASDSASASASASPSPPRASPEAPHSEAAHSEATPSEGAAHSGASSLSPVNSTNSTTATPTTSNGAGSASNGGPNGAGAASNGAPHASHSGPNRKQRTRSLASRSKPRQPSFNGSNGAPEGLKPLNTHSPIAVAAASAVTADKIKKQLIAQGPLPIRHITSHLAATIPGFGELSLSKQRRLIIAVLDAPKSEFIKVGWGRWAVQGDTIIRKESLGAASLNASSMRQAVQQAHRESISRRLPDNKLPLSPPLGATEGSAVFSDSESEFDDDSEVENTDEEDWQSIGPTKLRQTTPREQDAIAALVQLRSN